MRKNILFILFLLSIIASCPIFSQLQGSKFNILCPRMISIKGDRINMSDHTNLIENNNYIYLCGVIIEDIYTGYIKDTLYTPIFYKLSNENGHLKILWDNVHKKYNTGYIDTAFPQSPYKGVSFYHFGKGTMYQNSLGGFDIISSASKYHDSIKTLLILSFDSDGNLISEINNTDTNLLLHDYYRDYFGIGSVPQMLPTYIRTKENKILCLFQNGAYDDNNEDSLNLYQGNWVALEFDSIGNYIKKHCIFSFNDLAVNNKFQPRQGCRLFVSEGDITFSDEKDNIYILSNIRYNVIDYNIYDRNKRYRYYKDNLFIKLNKNFQTELYVFEKDINPDTTRDIMPMGVTLDKNDDIYISFRSFDCRYYADESRLPPRDTLYHIAKLSGKTGEVINVKNIDFNQKIVSMNIKTANDGNIYIYGEATSSYISPGSKIYYLAKIDNNLNIEWVEFPDMGYYPITDFIDLEPGHFALVGSYGSLNLPEIIEYIDNNDISDDKKRINILQYPNPAVEQVAINGSFDYIGDVSISIIDLNGNVLKSFDTYSNEKEFNYTFAISELPAGTYFVLIRYDNQNIIDKLVISR